MGLRSWAVEIEGAILYFLVWGRQRRIRTAAVQSCRNWIEAGISAGFPEEQRLSHPASSAWNG